LAKQLVRHSSKCSVCNQFCKADADFCVPFAEKSLEAGEKQLFCDTCATKLENEYVKLSYIKNSYVKSQWERRVAKRLGLVEVVCGADFTHWHNPKIKLPQGCKRV